MSLETAEEERTGTATYTRHTSRIEFMGGEDSEVVEWDDKQEEDGMLVLYDFVAHEEDINRTPMREHHFHSRKPFIREATRLIPLVNIKSFEAIGREKKEMEFTYTKEVSKHLVDDGEDDD